MAVFGRTNKFGEITGELYDYDRYLSFVKEGVTMAGLDPRAYATHSVRSGFGTMVQDAITGGLSEDEVKGALRNSETYQTYTAHNFTKKYDIQYAYLNRKLDAIEENKISIVDERIKRYNNKRSRPRKYWMGN